MYGEAITPGKLEYNKDFTVETTSNPQLRDTGQLLPFSMPSKLLILHGQVKYCCFSTISCESLFNDLKQFVSVLS